MVERTPLSPKDVVITRTVAKFGNTSYQIAAISSVSVQHQESANRNFLSAGLLLIIVILVVGFFAWASWIQAGIAGGIVVVITIILISAFPMRTATLALTTASGETQALTSRDIAGVEQVKLLIEDAFTGYTGGDPPRLVEVLRNRLSGTSQDVAERPADGDAATRDNGNR